MADIIWTPEFKSVSKFYSSEGANVEQLTFSDLEEAVFVHLDDEITPEELRDKIDEGETIDITAWNPDMPSREECSFLEDLLERLDETRTDEDCGSLDGEAMAKVKAAEQAFIDVLLANYSPWSCNPVCVISVNVARFVANLSEAERARLLK